MIGGETNISKSWLEGDQDVGGTTRLPSFAMALV
jgi:hypothetical protein